MTVATGSMALAKQNLLYAIADCAAFRTLVGASGDDAQAQARARIHRDAIVAPESGDIAFTADELQKLRPCVLLGTGDFSKENALSRSGRIVAYFFWDVPEAIATDPAEISLRVENLLGTIDQEMTVLARTGGYFDGEMEVEGVSRSARELYPTQGDFIWATVNFEWRGI